MLCSDCSYDCIGLNIGVINETRKNFSSLLTDTGDKNWFMIYDIQNVYIRTRKLLVRITPYSFQYMKLKIMACICLLFH